MVEEFFGLRNLIHDIGASCANSWGMAYTAAIRAATHLTWHKALRLQL